MTGRANAISSAASRPLPVTSAMTIAERVAATGEAEQFEEVAADLARRPRSGWPGRSPATSGATSDRRLRCCRRPLASSAAIGPERLGRGAGAMVAEGALRRPRGVGLGDEFGDGDRRATSIAASPRSAHGGPAAADPRAATPPTTTSIADRRRRVGDPAPVEASAGPSRRQR